MCIDILPTVTGILVGVGCMVIGWGIFLGAVIGEYLANRDLGDGQ